MRIKNRSCACDCSNAVKTGITKSEWYWNEQVLAFSNCHFVSWGCCRKASAQEVQLLSHWKQWNTILEKSWSADLACHTQILCVNTSSPKRWRPTTDVFLVQQAVSCVCCLRQLSRTTYLSAKHKNDLNGCLVFWLCIRQTKIKTQNVQGQRNSLQNLNSSSHYPSHIYFWLKHHKIPNVFSDSPYFHNRNFPQFNYLHTPPVSVSVFKCLQWMSLCHTQECFTLSSYLKSSSIPNIVVTTHWQKDFLSEM